MPRPTSSRDRSYLSPAVVITLDQEISLAFPDWDAFAAWGADVLAIVHEQAIQESTGDRADPGAIVSTETEGSNL